jgi:putative spermidine/putrescine transport system permease protein
VSAGGVFDRKGLLLVPALALLAAVFFVPVGTLLLRSVLDPAPGLQNYQAIATQPVYARALWNTVEISVTVTLICLAAGYPLAYSMARAGTLARRLLVFAVLVPFWSSILVRTFAWLVLLQRRGLVNQTLLGLGLTDSPLTLVHNRVGVLIGMVHILLPFMVLPLYSVMTRIDAAYMHAASSLGASPVRSFWRIYLPLSRPGIVNGAVLVFILGLGYFITPALLGGPRDTMIAQLIQSQIAEFGEWGMAGALSVVLLFAVGVSFATIHRTLQPVPRT